MADISDDEIDAALRRGQEAHQNEPQAAAARYDPQAGLIIVDLTNGCSFSFPCRVVQVLADASDEQIASVEVLGQGFGLHWEALDLDLSVSGLLAGRFAPRRK